MVTMHVIRIMNLCNTLVHTDAGSRAFLHLYIKRNLNFANILDFQEMQLFKQGGCRGAKV